jgi:DNA-binding NarL/FixJ family response regulator
MTIRVVIAEDNTLLREGLARVIELSPDLELVEATGDLPCLLSAIEAHAPDVVVTDIRMPPSGTDEGIQVATRLRSERPDVAVVVLSQYAEAAYATALFEHGAERRAYLLKERIADPDELTNAIVQVHQGGSVTDPKVVEQLVSAGRPARPTELERLTPRELEVLAQMASGRSNAAIAQALVLSERAVEKHSNSIFSKLGLTEEPDVNRRVKAVILFLEEGRGG